MAGEGPVLIMILLLSFMPNSPRFLLSKGRDEEALQALTWLRADSEVHWEFEQIQDNVRRQVQHGWDHRALCGSGHSLGLLGPWLPFLKQEWFLLVGRAQAASGGWVSLGRGEEISLRPTGAKTGWPGLESLA